jgi:hypothetical protein
MRLYAEKQEKILVEAVQRACSSAAKYRRADPLEGWGPVCLAIIQRLERIEHLKKPLEHYVRYTARLEARKFFLGARPHHQEAESCISSH